MRRALIVFAISIALGAQTPPKKVTLQKFGEGDLLVVRTQKGFTTLIEFPEGQPILEVTCGDKDFWVIEGKGRFLHVKPAKEGAITNLNALVEGDVVYSFLLKEISRTANGKPDLRVVVNGGDDLAKVRSDRDKLEEALAKSERALKELNHKYDDEKKRNLGREAAPTAAGAKALPSPAATGDRQATSDAATESKPAVPAGTAAALPPADAGSQPDEQKPIASAYVVERKSGLLRSGGRLLERLFDRVNSALHIY